MNGWNVWAAFIRLSSFRKKSNNPNHYAYFNHLVELSLGKLQAFAGLPVRSRKNVGAQAVDVVRNIKPDSRSPGAGLSIARISAKVRLKYGTGRRTRVSSDMVTDSHSLTVRVEVELAGR